MIDRVEFEEKEHERLRLDFTEKEAEKFEEYYMQYPNQEPALAVHNFCNRYEDEYWSFVETEYIDYHADLMDHRRDVIKEND